MGLRLGAALHFLISIGHIGCLFALGEAFEAYGIREIMHQMVSGHVWMLYALTIGLVLAFTLAGLYALHYCMVLLACHSSLIDAEYPKCLAISAKIRNFATSKHKYIE